MIAENSGGSSPDPITRVDPAEYPLTYQDCALLQTRHGLQHATIDAARFGSIRTQSALKAFGFDLKLEQVRSTLIIPYPPADDAGTFRFRLEQGSAPDTAFPIYRCPSRQPSDTLVIANSEYAALAAWQLGHNAIGINGGRRLRHDLDELVAIIEQLHPQHILIAMETIKPNATHEGELDGKAQFQ